MSMRIQVEGVGEVEVDPSFAQLSPQDQESLIGEIRQSVSAGRLASDMAEPATTSINASRSDFDFATLRDVQPPSQAQPQAATPQSLEGTPFDYGRGVPILEQFAADFIDKENLRTGAKFGDKATIEADWINSRNQIYGPEFESLGISPAKAQIAAVQVSEGKARNMLEALGVPEPKADQTANLAPSVIEEIGKQQTIIRNNLELADATTDSMQRNTFRRSAADATRRIRELTGAPQPTPYEEFESNRLVLDELNRKREQGGLGTVEYDGVPYPVSEAVELEGTIASRQADLLDRLATDPEARKSIRVSLFNAQVPKKGKDGKPLKDADGKLILDEGATTARYAELLAKAKPGEIVEREDGTIGPFMGVKEERSGDWTPKGIKPIIKGASVVAGDIADAVTPYVTRENISRASSVVGSAVPTLGAPIQAAISMTEDGGAKLKKGATTAMKTALAGGLTGGTTGPNYLAMLGLEYLSSVGRRAQEEEEKRRAGQ